MAAKCFVEMQRRSFTLVATMLGLLIVVVYSFKHSRSSQMTRIRSAGPVRCSVSHAEMTPETVLSDKEKLRFMRDGHLLKRGLINPGLITDTVAPSLMKLFNQNILTAWKHKLKINLGLDSDATKELTVAECEKLLEGVDKEDIPFMQLFNMWYASDDVRSLALSSELGHVAAQLLGTKSVRLYQDALFVKRSGDGPTRWHSDLNMAPFDTNDFVTCWIPLQKVPSQSDGGSGLSFASGSHRDFALPYWSEPTETDLSERYQTVTDYDGFEVGDCTWHHGWTLHSAPGNSLPDTRFAYSISFVADGVNLLQGEGHIRYPDNEDFQSYALWIDDIGWGGVADHPLIPVVYQDDSVDDDDI